MENVAINCPLKPKDYGSDQEVKWCPGCGDYAVLNAVQRVLSEENVPKEKAVFISGIGCSSRFPYYIDTYGFHSIHGRPLAIATGTKIVNPELNVWVVSGDGDALAIGGNHFIHALRRNVNLNLLLFNNQIYGLTKGQYSPTTKQGQVTKSSPHGTIDIPFEPGKLVLGSEGKFYARVVDTDVKFMASVLLAANQHTGLSVVEVLQNCVIFNDKVHDLITNKAAKQDHQLLLEHGKPMLFGQDNQKGIRLNGLELEVVTLGQNGVTMDDILVHDAHTESAVLHNLLIDMKLPEFPIALGVIRDVKALAYDELLHAQIAEQQEHAAFNSLDELFASGNTFEVK